jgi:Ca-activated chloride channel family protein
MPESSRRRNRVVAVVVLLVVLLLAATCYTRRTPSSTSTNPSAGHRVGGDAAGGTATAPPAATRPEERLSAATLTAPPQVAAGAEFAVGWTGPDNRGDFVTVAKPAASAQEHGHYQETRHGPSLKLTAPVGPGTYELRYVTGTTRTILARAPVEVTPVGATLAADDAVVLGRTFAVAWTGPNNRGDYVTIVARGAADAAYGDYVETEKAPSPLTLTAPAAPGDAELRYVAAQGRTVLARRPIRVLMPDVGVTGPDSATAGSTIQVKWVGPGNRGDYVTVVPKQTPDGQFGNYTETSKGSPVELLVPIMSGDAELRYMTGQGNKVLARRALKVVAAEVKLSAPNECKAGADVTVTWTGPNNRDDYVTIVPKATPDGQYAAYTPTKSGSPLAVAAPKQPGEAEIRYMTGQGNKVLARVPIRVITTQ